MMGKISDEALVELARQARERSHCPYSNISVGAALLTREGKVYLGANIENAAFSPSVCAERVAFFKAISEGESDFAKIAIAGAKRGEEARALFPPCGVCRQVMAEFCCGDFEILMAVDGGFEKMSLDEILPKRFDNSKM